MSKGESYTYRRGDGDLGSTSATVPRGVGIPACEACCDTRRRRFLDGRRGVAGQSWWSDADILYDQTAWTISARAKIATGSMFCCCVVDIRGYGVLG